MRQEYDFAAGERGKFHRPGARLIAPIHLESDVLDYLSERAEARGQTLEQLVNGLLRADIALIQAAG